MLLETGLYHARICTSANDLSIIRALRQRCFGAPGAEADAFDARAQQILIERMSDGAAVASFRVLTLRGSGIDKSYSAQFYDLKALHHFPNKMLELGRFCIAPEVTDPDVLRVAWAGITRLVDEAKIGLLFGCASFKGTQTAPYASGFAALQARYLAPAKWAPQPKAPARHAFGPSTPNVKPSLNNLPPLLRSYLSLGGWVSDHAVIDRQMNTLHVFTGVEVATIPEARQKALRALAATPKPADIAKPADID